MTVDFPALQEAQARLDTVTAEIKRFDNFDRLTTTQKTQRDDLEMDADDLRAKVRDLKRIRDLAAGLKAGTIGLESGDGAGIAGYTAKSTSPLVDAARRTVDRVWKSAQIPDHAAQATEKLLTQSKGRDQHMAARWAITAGSDAYLGAFAKMLADPDRGHMLWNAEEHKAFQAAAELNAEMKAMAVGTDSAGGFMVPLTLDPAIMLTSDGSISPLRQVSRVVTTVTDQWQGVTSAGVSAHWRAEAGEMDDDSPTLDDAPIPVHRADAFVPFSFEVGMDAVNFSQELQKLLVDAAEQLSATAYTTGSGTGQPKGIITALAGGSSELDGSGESVGVVDVYAVQNQLPPRFQARARWMANISTLNAIAQMETTNGARLFPEIAANPPSLLRKPAHELSTMDGVINPAATENNRVLLYGDFAAGFVIVDRIGTQVELVPHLFGANRRPTGQRGLAMWFRTGSDVVVPQAFRMLNVNTTA